MYNIKLCALLNFDYILGIESQSFKSFGGGKMLAMKVVAPIIVQD
jgi:hypothetical protein